MGYDDQRLVGVELIVEPNYSNQRVRVGDHDEMANCDKKLKFFESNILIK